MLTRAENDLLTQVGPGTPMGAMMRRYWFPALLSEELPENGGTPIRVRLLGEDLVAFRDDEGRVGLLAEHCPHRGASLALALNAECGLRCIYHGYKFDAAGVCTDTPTEPRGSNFAAKIRAIAYATHEAGGVVWAYMGPEDVQPPFPRFECLDFPDGYKRAYKVFEECNYAQGVEGVIDSAHAGVLHRMAPWGGTAILPYEADLSPTLEIQFTQYGMRYGAIRHIGENLHARITPVALPFYSFIPPAGGPDDFPARTRRLLNAFVPRDDTTTWHFQFFFDTERPIDTEFRKRESGLEIDEHFRKRANLDNWYRQDRAMMKREHFSGLAGVVIEDHAVVETQGTIADRTAEHLGTSDVALIAWRRLMLRAARNLAESGATPPGAGGYIPYERIRAESLAYPESTSWKDVNPLEPALAI